MSIMTKNTKKYIKTKKTFMSIMTKNNKLTRPPEVDKGLHRKVKIFAAENDYTIRGAYEVLLKLGLKKESERDKNEKI
jgi:hypothetical protein